MTYLLNAGGDIYGRTLENGSHEDVDPDAWGWAGPAARLPAEDRCTLDELRSRPGFDVVVTRVRAWTPGPRPPRTRWMEWVDGSAPPACYESARGAAGYYSRLSDVLGHVAVSMPRNPDSSPYVVHDLVQGRRIEVSYVAPPPSSGGQGLVYVLDDGHALKFGHTTNAPVLRINDLQTGNPRLIRLVATIAPASDRVESYLHRQLDAWFVRGEWYEREPIFGGVKSAGGWEPFLLDLLPGGDWTIDIYHRAPDQDV